MNLQKDERLFLETITFPEWPITDSLFKAFRNFELAAYVVFLKKKSAECQRNGTMINGGFPCPIEEQKETLFFCANKIRRFKRKLQELKILKLKRIGNLSQEYYYLDSKALYEIL